MPEACRRIETALAMNYDDIERGRRRNWEALKPEEIRQREREERRAERMKELAEKAKKGKTHTAFDRVKRMRQDEESRADRERFQRVLRQSGVLIGAFIFVILVFYSAQAYLEKRRQERLAAEVTEYDRVLVEGEEVNDLSDPVGALATWRSAWMEGDMARVVSLFSPHFMRQLTKSKPYNVILREYQTLYQKGSLQSTVDMATNFDGPQILRIPRKPWSHGELALFRSDYLLRPGDDPPGRRYILAFSWDAKNEEWRYATLREEKFFSIKWKFESAIQQKVGGMNPVTYDEEGNRITGGGL